MIVFEILYFIFLLFVVLYIPGRYILRRISYEASLQITIPLAIGVGLSVFLFTTYLLAWFKIDFLYLFVIFFAIYKEYKHSYQELTSLSVRTILFSPLFLIVSMGVLVMNYLTWSSGIERNHELLFYGSNGIDGIYHISLIENLLHTFPLQHPGLAGVPLRGYHFFYDFLIANFIKYFKLDLYDSVFRLFPLFIATFYGLCGIAVAKFLKATKLVTAIFVFLLYFVQGFEYFYLQPFSKGPVFYDSGITQGILTIVNPSVLIALAFLFLAYILVFSQPNKLSFILLGGFILGVTIQIKIYVFFLAVIALGIVSVISLLKDKKIYLFFGFLITCFVSIILYFPTNWGAGGLLFKPLLLYRHFMEGSSISLFDQYHWGQKQDIYIAHKNYIRIMQLYLMGICLFYLPSLGIRILIFAGIKEALQKKFYSLQNIFWMSMIVLAFLIASFFIQTVGNFNIVQFLWIAYSILLLPTAYVLARLFGRLTKRKLILIACFLVSISLPSNISMLRTSGTHLFIVSKELFLLTEDIRTSLPRDKSFIVLYREKDFGERQIPLLSALTGRSVYYEPELTAFADIDTEVTVRKKTIKEIEDMLYTCNDVEVVDKKIKDIMLRTNNTYILALDKNPCLPSLDSFDERKQAENYYIYSLK